MQCRDSRGGATTSSSGSRRGHSSSSASGDASTQVGAIAGSMACLLQRLAYGESLSLESRGGGRQSNARLLPYLFQLGQYFAGFCSDSDLQARLSHVTLPGFKDHRFRLAEIDSSWKLFTEA